MPSDELTCLECWRGVGPDLHFDCTGEHFVPRGEADGLREWLNGRYAFMVRTGQCELRPDCGAVV